MATKHLEVPRHWAFPHVSRRGIVLSLLLLLALLAAGFGWLLFQPSSAKGGVGGVGIGQAAPNFTLPDTTGKLVSLQGLRGHRVIINFWTTYCPACVAEQPMLEQFYTAHQAEGLVMLGIDEGEPLEVVLPFRERFRVTYPSLLDRTLQFNNTASYNPVLLPRTYFIDQEGTIRAVNDGELSPQELQTGYQASGT